MEKMKYVRIKEYDSIIIFPIIIEHKEFKKFNPVTAGFCYIQSDRVRCFGESISLGIKSDEKQDSLLATKQICGIRAMIEIIEKP